MNPSSIVGTVTNPITGYQSVQNGGLILFLTNILRVVFVVAGIYAFINFIIAGFQYMSSAGDSKALSAALDRIWYSLLGLIIVMGSFALASLIGFIVFHDANFILQPQIYGPGQ